MKTVRSSMIGYHEQHADAARELIEQNSDRRGVVTEQGHASRRGAGTNGRMKAGMLGTPNSSRNTAAPRSR